MAHYWRWRQFIHSMIGIISGVLTLASTILILKFLDWSFYFNSWHTISGMIFMGLCQIVVVGGLYSLCIRRAVNMDWKTQ